MSDLPLTPDVGRYFYCISCNEMFEFNIEESEVLSDVIDDYDGENGDKLLFDCPECGTMYAQSLEDTCVTRCEALESAVNVLSKDFVLPEPKLSDWAKSILFDQVKEMVEIKTCIEHKEFDYALELIDEQIDYIEKNYGSDDLSESVSTDHITEQDNDKKEAIKKDRENIGK